MPLTVRVWTVSWRPLGSNLEIVKNTLKCPKIWCKFLSSIYRSIKNFISNFTFKYQLIHCKLKLCYHSIDKEFKIQYWNFNTSTINSKIKNDFDFGEIHRSEDVHLPKRLRKSQKVKLVRDWYRFKWFLSSSIWAIQIQVSSSWIKIQKIPEERCISSWGGLHTRKVPKSAWIWVLITVKTQEKFIFSTDSVDFFSDKTLWRKNLVLKI